MSVVELVGGKLEIINELEGVTAIISLHEQCGCGCEEVHPCCCKCVGCPCKAKTELIKQGKGSRQFVVESNKIMRIELLESANGRRLTHSFIKKGSAESEASVWAFLEINGNDHDGYGVVLHTKASL